MPQTNRQRGYVMTINNWTASDLTIVESFIASKYVTYLVMGFEVGENGTEHIQAYMHFTEGRTKKWVHEYWPRAALLDPRAEGDKFANRYLYCMKYDDKRKTNGLFEVDPDGFYIEFGDRPNPPKDKQPKKSISLQIMERIQEGATMADLTLEFPGYMLQNHSKVKDMHDRLKKDPDRTKFYYLTPLNDALTEIIEYFGPDTVSSMKIAAVEQLAELEAYDEYDTVIWFNDYPEQTVRLYPRGIPILYKHGYIYKKVKCKRFIVVCKQWHYLTMYKKIISYF